MPQELVPLLHRLLLDDKPVWRAFSVALTINADSLLDKTPVLQLTVPEMGQTFTTELDEVT